MDRHGREDIAAGRLEGLWLELGEVLDCLLDGGLNAVLSAQVSERFTGNSWAKGVKSLDQTPKPEIGDDLGCDFADRPERAAGGRVCWAVAHDTPSHRQIARCPK